MFRVRSRLLRVQPVFWSVSSNVTISQNSYVDIDLLTCSDQVLHIVLVNRSTHVTIITQWSGAGVCPYIVCVSAEARGQTL